MSHQGHNCNYKSFFVFLVFLLSANSFSPVSRAEDATDVQESHPGISRESRYSEAVIAYNKKQTAEAIKILDELLKESPQNIEYLELKALALKGAGDEKSSLALYQQLYQAKPEKERGPYAFEIASILEKQKKFSDAKPYYEKAIELGFNVEASNLYLGLAAFNEGHYFEAEQYFYQVTRGSIQELELVGHYYRSLCYFKLNFGARGIQEMLVSRDVSETVLKNDPKNPTAKSIQDSATKMLDPFSKGQFFGNVALMTQYDSNIQQLPAATSNTNIASNSSTLKENILGGIGYMSAPLNMIQFVVGYRASYNKNFNSATKGFEYFTNSGSLFINYRSLATFTWGVKIESNYAFQNSLIDPAIPTSGYEFQKYSFTVGAGPYVRYQLNRNWRADLETVMRDQKYYADPTQSGTNTNLRLSVRKGSGDSYFNPGFSVLYEKNSAAGDLNWYSAFGGGFTNYMTLPGAITFIQSLDYLSTNYSRTNPVRKDSNVSVKLSGIKLLSPKVSLLGDVNFISNTSSVAAAYTYQRWMTSLGIAFAI